MKFGFRTLKKLNGAGLYVCIMQIAALLPVLYIFIASGYMSVLTKKNVLSFLFDTGVSILPRAEVLGVSKLFHLTGDEIIVCLILPLIALIFGLILNPLLKSKSKAALITRIVLIVLIAADVVVRLLPFSFNRVFGIVPSVIGLVVRAGCIVLIALDIAAEKKNKSVE